MDGPKDDMAKSVSANAEKNHVGKAKRKPGRPLAYQGDPFSPDVTPDERRVILRRVANRESARRVRVRHNESMERAFKEAECLERSNSILYQKLDRAQAFEARLQTDLAQLHKEVIAKGCENAHLCTVIARMRDQEATMRLLQASIKDLLPEVLGNESCTDFAIQPDTIDAPLLGTGDPLATDGEWLACLNRIADQ